MVHIVLKGTLPVVSEVMPRLQIAAKQAHSVVLREQRPPGFPLLFTADWQLIEVAALYLHEHAVQRAHTSDTLRTYSEILYDWFETLEQNGLCWNKAEATDLIAYRNRMLVQLSSHTGRPYSVATINHRVRGVLRFYEWVVRNGWLPSSTIAGSSRDFSAKKESKTVKHSVKGSDERGVFVLRQFESLPRPLMAEQARELLSVLPPPYDLMGRWQLYTGLRVSELLRLRVCDIPRNPSVSYSAIDVLRKGRKSGYVLAPASLLEESDQYMSGYRAAWQMRANSKRGVASSEFLFLNRNGRPVSKNSYQRIVAATGRNCGFKSTTHVLRATFACMLLARLQSLANKGVLVNPLLTVKILMGHERIQTTDRYLRAIAVDSGSLKDVLEQLLAGEA